MSRVSKRALVNFVVDAAIAAAFVVSAVSGFVFLVPAGWLSLSGSSTSALGVEYATWRTLHDWTAVIMIAGRRAAHRPALALGHDDGAAPRRRRAGRTRLTRSRQSRRCHTGRRAATQPGRRRRRRDSRRRSAALVAPDAFAASGRAQRESNRAPRPGRVPGASGARLTRNAFLKRAGAVGAAALVGGLVGRAAAGAAVSWLGDGVVDGRARLDHGVARVGLDRRLGARSGDELRTARARPVTTSSRPVRHVDGSRRRSTPGRCTGCGDCLRVCPYGVFAASGSQVVVTDADACRLCGHCTAGLPRGRDHAQRLRPAATLALSRLRDHGRSPDAQASCPFEPTHVPCTAKPGQSCGGEHLSSRTGTRTDRRRSPPSSTALASTRDPDEALARAAAAIAEARGAAASRSGARSPARWSAGPSGPQTDPRRRRANRRRARARAPTSPSPATTRSTSRGTSRLCSLSGTNGGGRRS